MRFFSHVWFAYIFLTFTLTIPALSASVVSASKPTPADVTAPLPSVDAPYKSAYQSSVRGYNETVPAAASRILPLPGLVFNVKHYGARGDGKTDDTWAIRGVLALARTLGGGTIYFPTGVYMVAPQPIDGGWTSATLASSTAGAVFDLSFSNVALLGDGPKNTIISVHTLGMTDPTTHWWVTGDSYFKIKRGAAFSIFGPSSGQGLTNIQFVNLRVTGNTLATGNSMVGGNPTTGDGWDLSHKGVLMGGGVPTDNVVFKNVEFDGFRGEILYYGGDGNKITIVDTYLHDTNADAISMSADVYITGTTITNAYNGLENLATNGTQRTVVLDSLIDGNWRGGTGNTAIVFIGVSSSGLYIGDSTIQNFQHGVYLAEFADNVTIQGNVFSDNVTDVYWLSLNLYPQISTTHYDNTWINGNVFQAPTIHAGQVFYDPLRADVSQRNLVISNNVITQKPLFFIDSTMGTSAAYRPNFEIFGNQFFSGQLWEDVQLIGNRPLWHNNWFGSVTPQKVDDFSQKPVVRQVAPGGGFLLLGGFWNAASTISLAQSLAAYPIGFELSLIGPPSHGYLEKLISIRPDPAWNNLIQAYPLKLNAVLKLKKGSDGRFSFESYYPGNGW